MAVSRSATAVRCPHCQRLFDSAPPEASGAEEAAGPASDAELVSSETVTLDPNAPAPAADGEEAEADAGAAEDGTAAPARSEPAADSARSASVRQAGEMFGKYEIIREIARGGMGIVYLARQPTLRRTVALKVLRAGEGATDEDFSRFLREAEAAACLAHPNIVPIHELDVHEGRPFFTMDFIEGPNLESLIAAGRLTLRESVEILETTALAIDYAHSKGIVHRDLKPGNVILARDGTPMITDFGLAVNLARDPETQRMTHSGVVMGTIPYIPPEQAAGEVDKVGPASDIYSLGALLYEMITGQPPFEGETQFELLHCVLHRDPVPPRRLNARIPPDLQTICLKCLEKPLHRRYASARALAEDCRAFLNGEMIKARPSTPWYRAWRTISRHRGLSALAAGVVVLTLAFLLVWRSYSEAQKVTEQTKEQAERAEQEKEQTARQLEQVRAEKEELTAALDRGWRPVLYDRFRRLDRGQWSVESQAAAFERGYLLLRGPPRPAPPPESEEADAGPPKTISAALVGGFPGDVQVEFKVYVPRDDGGAVAVMLSGAGLQLSGNFGYLFTVGPPAAPGARIEKGPAALASKPDVVLTPATWQTIRAERRGTVLALYLNDELALEATDETMLRADEYNRIGFLAVEGLVYLDDVRVSQPGSSRQMLVNMLDMADDFYRHGRRSQLNFAIEMAEQVARETDDPALYLRALRRLAGGYLRRRGNLERAWADAELFIRRLAQAPEGLWQPEQEPYFHGLLALENRNYARATDYFDRAASAGEGRGRFALLARLQGVLSRIRQGEVKSAVDRLTAMQRDDQLKRIAETCREELHAGDTHAVFMAEMDRLLEAKQADTVWSFLEALRILFPESGRDLAARCLGLARLYEEREQWDEALDRFQAARALAPSWEEPALALARAQQRRDQMSEARATLAAAAQEFPESSLVQQRLAAFLLENVTAAEQLIRAQEVAQRAVRLTGRNDATALELLARIHLARGQRQEALGALEEALALDRTPQREELLQELRPALEASDPDAASATDTEAAVPAGTPEGETLKAAGGERGETILEAP